jgi:tRNA (guanosine-2'-O-)-methyltransferase
MKAAMRRRTAGVVSADEVVDRLIARAEREDPARVVRLLEPLVTPVRRERMREVIGARLSSVAVVFDGPYDPHNGAAVLRSCEAFGVQALHVVERAGTPFLVASSVARGAEKWLDVTRHAAAATAIEAARAAGLELVAAHPEGSLEPKDLAAIPRVAIVLGNERQGIREELARACSRAVRVPMRGFVESLNVSVTAAILLQAATAGRSGDLDEATRLRLYARGLYMSVPHAKDVMGVERED